MIEIIDLVLNNHYCATKYDENTLRQKKYRLKKKREKLLKELNSYTEV